MNRLDYLALISLLALSGACEGKIGQDALLGGAQSAGGATPANVGSAGGVSGASGTDLPMYCNGLLAGKTCSETILQADRRVADMLLVIDDSGSMRDYPNSTTTDNKWALLGQALTTSLAPFANEINFGLLLFPYDPAGIDTISPVSSCNVPVGAEAINVGISPGTANEESIVDFIRNQVPAGGTPTSKALQQAYSYFTQGDGRNLIGSKWVILITDGGPNCNEHLQCTADTCISTLDMKCGAGTNCCDTAANPSANLACLDDQATISQIANLKAAGVQTFVVGLPGSEPFATTLDNMAQTGGVPNQNSPNGQNYYAVSASNYAQDISDDLTQIMTTLVGPLIGNCNLQLHSTPANPSSVIVVVDCALLSQVPVGTAADAGVDGYYLDYSQVPPLVRIVGAPCNNIMTNGAQRVDVIEGCTPNL